MYALALALLLPVGVWEARLIFPVNERVATLQKILEERQRRRESKGKYEGDEDADPDADIDEELGRLLR